MVDSMGFALLVIAFMFKLWRCAETKWPVSSSKKIKMALQSSIFAINHHSKLLEIETMRWLLILKYYLICFPLQSWLFKSFQIKIRVHFWKCIWNETFLTDCLISHLSVIDGSEKNIFVWSDLSPNTSFVIFYM